MLENIDIFHAKFASNVDSMIEGLLGPVHPSSPWLMMILGEFDDLYLEAKGFVCGGVETEADLARCLSC